MLKYGIMAHRKGGRFPDANRWCKDESGKPLVFESREEAQAVATEYNDNLKRDHNLGRLRIWYTVSVYLETKHTPDWHLEYDGAFCMSGQVVASLDQLGPDGTSHDQKLANAALIVAAPKMLAMLVEAVELLERGSRSQAAASRSAWMTEVRELISKVIT